MPDHIPEISVIVPIYNQPALVEQCIDHVLAAKNEICYRLILIDDASSDKDVGRVLAKFDGLPNVELLYNPYNLGFTQTVNRGIDLAIRDSYPLLLNSDTMVYDHWLDGMMHCMKRAANVATVTPLTNQKGSHISCYPEARWANNELPELAHHSKLARLAHEHCYDAEVTVHVGTGFCLLLNPAAVRAVGELDATKFPRAYGEESDFCYRTRYLGWQHKVCGSTFVTHLHNQSFGLEKQKLMDEMINVFVELHPTQPQLDADFRITDVVQPIRRQLDFAQLSDQVLEVETISVIDSEAKLQKNCVGAYLAKTGTFLEFATSECDAYLTNIGRYDIPIDTARLIHDLENLGIHSISFREHAEIAEDLVATCEMLQIACDLEVSSKGAIFSWAKT